MRNTQHTKKNKKRGAKRNCCQGNGEKLEMYFDCSESRAARIAVKLNGPAPLGAELLARLKHLLHVVITWYCLGRNGTGTEAVLLSSEAAAAAAFAVTLLLTAFRILEAAAASELFY